MLVEGATDEPVARRLLDHIGLMAGTVYGSHGKGHLLKRLPAYNHAARFTSWFVMIDLDNDATCVSDAIKLWLPNPEAGMRLRVAVRSVEAWLIADREHLAAFLHVAPSRLPQNPDREMNPKQTLINIARASTVGNIRRDFVPRQEGGARVGPLYVDRLNEFTIKYWQPEDATRRSESLRRCIASLSTLKS
jgi:hypothetical protein